MQVSQEIKKVDEDEVGKEEEVEESQDRLRIKDMPELQTYFKMLKMGVPHEAVKLKMARENVDVSLLDRPEDFCE